MEHGYKATTRNTHHVSSLQLKQELQSVKRESRHVLKNTKRKPATQHDRHTAPKRGSFTTFSWTCRMVGGTTNKAKRWRFGARLFFWLTAIVVASSARGCFVQAEPHTTLFRMHGFMHVRKRLTLVVGRRMLTNWLHSVRNVFFVLPGCSGAATIHIHIHIHIHTHIRIQIPKKRTKTNGTKTRTQKNKDNTKSKDTWHKNKKKGKNDRCMYFFDSNTKQQETRQEERNKTKRKTTTTRTTSVDSLPGLSS